MFRFAGAALLLGIAPRATATEWDEADNRTYYVLECDTECNMICYEVVRKEATQRDRPLCTVRDALLGDSRKGCDKPPPKCGQDATALSFSLSLLFSIFFEGCLL